MIKTAIKQTAITSARANEYFINKIDGATMNDDVSMTATCRALFGPRLQEKERIAVLQKTHMVRENVPFDAVLDDVRSVKPGTLMIYNILNPGNSTINWMETLRGQMANISLYPLEDIEHWFKHNGIKALVYTNSPHDPKVPKSPVDNSASVIFIEGLNMSRWHTIQTLIGRLMGKWFVEKPMTDEERQGIILAMNKGDEQLYLSTIEKYASTLDFRSGFIRQKLNGFEKRFEKERIQQLQNEQQSIERKLDELERKIGEQLMHREDIIAMLHGYSMNGGDSEPYVMNYFLQNKNLVLKDCSTDYLTFFTSGWFDNWNPDQAKNIFGKNRMSSWLHYNSNYGIAADDAKLLYKAIFIDETVRVRLWSCFKIAMRGDDVVRALSDYAKPEEITNALPNPHHYYNHCMGGNSQLINQAMRVRDVISAIEQCCSATKGINIMEEVSYKYFTRDLFNPEFGAVVYVKELDKFVTTKEAIAFLKTSKEAAKEAK